MHRVAMQHSFSHQAYGSPSETFEQEKFNGCKEEREEETREVRRQVGEDSRSEEAGREKSCKTSSREESRGQETRSEEGRGETSCEKGSGKKSPGPQASLLRETCTETEAQAKARSETEAKARTEACAQ